jgi:hypothetical protein
VGTRVKSKSKKKNNECQNIFGLRFDIDFAIICINGVKMRIGCIISCIMIMLFCSELFCAKIYITDMYNNRIVRIDDMNGNGFQTFGEYGRDYGYICFPTFLWVRNDSVIYFSNSGRDCVVRMSNFSGLAWTEFGTRGVYYCEMERPYGIYVSPDSLIYVGEMGNDRVQRFRNMSCEDDALYAPRPSGFNGVDEVVYYYNYIYAGDWLNHRIVRFNPDLTTPFYESYGSYGSGINQFNEVQGVAFDSLGRMYVCDDQNGRIVRVDDFFGTGWISYGTRGSGIGQFSEPCGIFISIDQKIYVVDSGNNRIVRINNISGAGWISYGTHGSGEGQFNMPGDIFVVGTEQGQIGIEESEPVLQQGFTISIEPNPFKESVHFYISNPAIRENISNKISVKVYDTMGKQITEIGKAPFIWSPPSEQASGVYLARISCGDFRQLNKIVLLI